MDDNCTVDQEYLRLRNLAFGNFFCKKGMLAAAYEKFFNHNMNNIIDDIVARSTKHIHADQICSASYVHKRRKTWPSFGSVVIVDDACNDLLITVLFHLELGIVDNILVNLSCSNLQGYFTCKRRQDKLMRMV